MAVAAAGDYSSGLIRLLVQPAPRRWRLVAGTLVVLAGLTVGTAALATAISVVGSPIVAGATDVSTARWGIDLVAARPGRRGWLPGSTIQALVYGGNDAVSYERTLAFALAYGLAAVAVSFAVFQRRDVAA